MTTGIEWTDATWNPIAGCTKISEGCRNCYAERMARRLAGRCGYPEAPHHFDVTLHPDKLDQPLRWKKPRKVFVCSMGDLFHRDLDDWDDIFPILSMCKEARQHTFLILSKRAERMKKIVDVWYVFNHEYMPWPNIWLGVTAENQEQADLRIPDLLRTPAAVRFVSVEPMLGEVDLSDYLGFCPDCDPYMALHREHGDLYHDDGPRLDWVIIGCESGPNRRPMELEWALDLVRQCDAAEVPVFVKQIPVDGRVSHDPTEWPAELQRREYPK